MPEAGRPPRRPGSSGHGGAHGGQGGHGSAARNRSRQRPSERGRRTDPVRLAAYTVMRAIADGAYANLELPQVLREKRLTGRDAAFATELVYGATRMRGLYDAIVQVAADRSLAEVDGRVLDTLRLGIHQLLGMRVATHAAVDETVALARQVNGSGASGFVNAVLRRVTERDRATWLDVVAPKDGDPLVGLARRSSHPEWVVRALRQALVGHGSATPEDVDPQLARLLLADNAAPRVTLAARPGLSDPAELMVEGATPGPFARTAVLLSSGDPGAVAAVREGRAAVQDEGSQLVALALAAAPVNGGAHRPDPERWLDLCAGPGGKAGLLAGLALERGADLVANEVSPHRADLVRHTLAAAVAQGRPRQITVRTGDGREVGSSEPEAYDRVLVDAPCTGLGALRRRPEARWRRQPSDVPTLATLQRELLTSALDATRRGGVVAYATCSPHLGETRFVVADVVKRRSDVELLDAGACVVDRHGVRVEGTGDAPFVQLWPHVHHTDGMFLALLRRR